MAVSVTIDLESIQAYSDALKSGKKILLAELAKAYGDIGRYDIEKIRSNASGQLTLKSQGAIKSFKYRSTAPSRATDFSKLFLSEYTGWKAAGIFQTGGVIVGKGKALLVEKAGRKYSPEKIKSLILSKKIRMVPTPRGTLLIESGGGLTKKGTWKTGGKGAGSRDTIVGILKKSVTEKKRLDFYETFESGASIHMQLLEAAVETTLEKIASDKG